MKKVMKEAQVGFMVEQLTIKVGEGEKKKREWSQPESWLRPEKCIWD